jgi:hypothetical protein
MGKPTTPNPGDLGPSGTPTDELKQAKKASREPEEAELVSVWSRREFAEYGNAVLARKRGRNPDELALLDQLIRDSRTCAQGDLAGARSHAQRIKITTGLWDRFVARHSDGEKLDKLLSFTDLHAAIWTEGYPSLEERAGGLRSYSQSGLERIGGREETSQRPQPAMRGSSESERTTTEQHIERLPCQW